MTAQLTVWVAYNSENDCYASHEGAEEAMDGLVQSFGYGEGARVVELKLALPSAKPVAVEAGITDTARTVAVVME
jgi:hypothetical protein